MQYQLRMFASSRNDAASNPTFARRSLFTATLASNMQVASVTRCWLAATLLVMSMPVWAATEVSDAETKSKVEASASEPAETPKKTVDKSSTDPTAEMTVDEILTRDPQSSDYVESPRCLSARRIRGVEVIDDQHVLFDLGRDEHYLVQFKHRCPMLRKGRPVIYEPTGNRLCEQDALRGVLEQGLGDLQPGPRCNIPDFQSLTKEQVVQLKEALRSTRDRARDQRKAKRKREKEAKDRQRERDAQAQRDKQVSAVETKQAIGQSQLERSQLERS